MSLKLCGIGMPLEDQNPVQGTAERLHTQTQYLITDNFRTYNVATLADGLNRFVEDAQGILRAIDQGNPVDLQGKLIDRVTIGRELETLSADLHNVDRVIAAYLASPAGIEHRNANIEYHNGAVVSFDERCGRIRELSGQMIALRALITQRIAEDRKSLLLSVDIGISATVEQTVPLDIVQLIGSYLPIE